jgi:hypothetical protein
MIFTKIPFFVLLKLKKAKGRAATNECRNLETRCKSVLKSGYFAAL